MKSKFIFGLLLVLTFGACHKRVKPIPVTVSLKNCHSFSGTYVYNKKNNGRILGVTSCNARTGIYANFNDDNIDFSNGTLADPVTSGVSTDTLFIQCYFADGMLVKTLKKHSFPDFYVFKDSCLGTTLSVDTVSIYRLLDYSIN